MAYNSILPEVWLTAVEGLAQDFLNVLNDGGNIDDLDFYDNHSHKTVSVFGINEARKHRYRGVSLEMFLGLMKYYRRSFMDLVIDKKAEKEDILKCFRLIECFFDRLEIGFCLEWTREQKDELVENLQQTNLQLAYEKNIYMALFESIPIPVILLNKKHRVENMNHSAVEMLMAGETLFFDYRYNQLGVEHLMPWLAEEFFKFVSAYDQQASMEKEVLMREGDKKNLVIKLHRMVDVSDIFKGTVVILNDFTESKQAEETLRYISFHDVLTGLYNRTYFEQQVQQFENDLADPLGIISFDVDGLKLVNDVLGHQAGDNLLVTAASVIHSCFREYDVVARTGGDEFAVILPNSPAEVVERASSRMREAVEKHNKENPLSPLSISMGWAVRQDPSLNLSRVCQQADSQMYQEKPWNREAFYWRFNELYKQFGSNLYNTKLNK